MFEVLKAASGVIQPAETQPVFILSGVANQPAPSTSTDLARSPRPLADFEELLSRLAQGVGETAAAALLAQMPVQPVSALVDVTPRLLSARDEAAEACGMGLTKFKEQLKLGNVPANYLNGRAVSFDAEVLRLWAMVDYEPFDRDHRAAWLTWLYSQFEMTVAGKRLDPPQNAGRTT